MGKNPSNFMFRYFALFDTTIHNDCLHRVYMQDFFRCDPEHYEACRLIILTKVWKIIRDMFYEARLQAVMDYHRQHLHQRCDRAMAKSIYLTKEQYMMVSMSP